MNDTVQKAVEALRLANPGSVEEVEAIFTEVRDLQRRYERAQQRAFSVGDRVTFESSKQGRPVVGTVTKLLQKNVKVQEDNGPEWRVSPSFLTRL